MTITILNTEELSFSVYESYLPLVSEEQRKKIEQYSKECDKLNSLMAELLARVELSKKLHISPPKLNFSVGEYGKPFLSDYPDVHFSISHSTGAVAFVCDNTPIGIDIEDIAGKKSTKAIRFFTENEQNYINSGDDIIKTMLFVWTRKEAYLKMLGKGLSVPLSCFDVLDGNLKCNIITKELDKHIISVCCDKEQITDFSTKTTKASDLLLFLKNNY